MFFRGIPLEPPRAGMIPNVFMQEGLAISGIMNIVQSLLNVRSNAREGFRNLFGYVPVTVQFTWRVPPVFQLALDSHHDGFSMRLNLNDVLVNLPAILTITDQNNRGTEITSIPYKTAGVSDGAYGV